MRRPGRTWTVIALCFGVLSVKCGGAECDEPCRQFGLCEWASGVCVARDDAACARSEGCAALGNCGKQHARCVPTAEGCAKSHACTVEGLCSSMGDDEHRVCTLERPFCKVECEERGNCTSDGAACVAANVVDCRASRECKLFGSCSLRGDACVIASDADCAGTEECARRGACSVVKGRCTTSSETDCANSEACALHSLCGFNGTTCTAPKPTPEPPRDDASCRKSEGCRALGLCRLYSRAEPWRAGSAGQCVTGTDADCKQSRACALRGECRATHWGCRPATDADCGASAVCREAGQCNAVSGNPRWPEASTACIATSAKECRVATKCQGPLGCIWARGTCIPAEAEHT